MKKFDLEERSLEFSKKIISLCKKLPFNQSNHTLIDQLIRSASSIGVNYREANETDTKKDFRNKIRIAKKEAKETVYWLELLLDSNQSYKEEIAFVLQESLELMKILAAIYIKIDLQSIDYNFRFRN